MFARFIFVCERSLMFDYLHILIQYIIYKGYCVKLFEVIGVLDE